MISSFLVSAAILALRKCGLVIPTHYALLIAIAATTVCWMLTAFLARQTDPRTLVEFYKKVRPFGPGWAKVRREAGISEFEARASHESFPLALIGWTSGVAVIWSALFTVGNVLYRRWNYALVLAGILVLSGLVLLRVIGRLWSGKRHEPRA
jgi:hypothetical protein